jgi:hypothetical protein
VLLLKKLKKKKRKHEFWIDIFLNWRQERDIFYSVVNDMLSVHLNSVRRRLRDLNSWKGFTVCNKEFSVKIASWGAKGKREQRPRTSLTLQFLRQWYL